MEQLTEIRELDAIMTSGATLTGDAAYDHTLLATRGVPTRGNKLLTDHELASWTAAAAATYKLITGMKRVSSFIAGRRTPLGYGPDVEFVTLSYAAQFIAFSGDEDSQVTVPLRLSPDPRFYCIRISSVPAPNEIVKAVGHKLASADIDAFVYIHIDLLPDLIRPTMLVWHASLKGARAPRAYARCKELGVRRDAYGIGAKYRQYWYEYEACSVAMGLQVISNSRRETPASETIHMYTL